MGGQTCTSTALLQMKASQHVIRVVEDGSIGSQLPSHYSQPSLDGSGTGFEGRTKSRVTLKVSNTLQRDLLSMEVSQVEPTLKPYNTYLPSLNLHRAEDGPLNSFDEVHKWVQLHRLDATGDRD